MGKITSHNNQRKNPPLFVDDSQLNNHYKIQVKMDNYIDSMIESLPESMGGECAMPVGNHLLTVNPDSSPLSTSESESFQHCVAKLISHCESARLHVRSPSFSRSEK